MEEKILAASKAFWDAMEHADEAGMRAAADPNCNFVHIGITCKLDKEMEFYTSGAFKPTDITFHSKKAEVFGGGSTAVVLTDCDYGLLLDGKPTTHQFMVTEVYVPEGDGHVLTPTDSTAQGTAGSDVGEITLTPSGSGFAYSGGQLGATYDGAVFLPPQQ